MLSITLGAPPPLAVTCDGAACYSLDPNVTAWLKELQSQINRLLPVVNLLVDGRITELVRNALSVLAQTLLTVYRVAEVTGQERPWNTLDVSLWDVGALARSELPVAEIAAYAKAIGQFLGQIPSIG